MSKSVKWRAGEVWERDGLRREIIEFMIGNDWHDTISQGEFGRVLWRRPPTGNERVSHIGSWMEWVSEATLVSGGGDG